MTKDTKRVYELEVGDIVTPLGCEKTLTVSRIEKRSGNVYRVYFENMEVYSVYGSKNEFTYLGNKKEEETMKNQKVDCSALYSYFDFLACEEVSLKGATNIPVYVRQQLKNIHELFEGVLELTLEEVKTLYFERKMNSQKLDTEDVSKLESKPRTKKAKELQPGDKVVGAITGKILTVSRVKEISHIEIIYKELEGKTYTTHLDNEYTLVD